MRMVCPECYYRLQKEGKGREMTDCFLSPITIFTKYPQAGECPLCKKIWNDDGREIIVTGQIKVETKLKEYNPSRRRA